MAFCAQSLQNHAAMAGVAGHCEHPEVGEAACLWPGSWLPENAGEAQSMPAHLQNALNCKIERLPHVSTGGMLLQHLRQRPEHEFMALKKKRARPADAVGQ